MDLSSAGGALLITVLRLLHIVGGLIWVGAAVVLSFYIEPALEKAGADGGRILRGLYSETSFPSLLPVSALVTTVAGLLLYGMMSYHETLGSSMGLALTLGALLGLLAFAHGFFAVWRPAAAYSALADSDADQAAALQGKLRRNGRVSMWLALASLALMAGARYIGPVLSL